MANGRVGWMFRTLSKKEEQEFRDHARKSYKPCSEINGLWHPVYQEECVLINKEHFGFTDDDHTNNPSTS